MVGIPKDGVARDARIELRVKPGERDAWTAAARRENKTISEWLREVANQASKRKGKR